MQKVILLLMLFLVAGVASSNNLESIVKKNGYAGLSELGIGRFLYKVKHEGGLGDGFNKVFWSDISDKDADVDERFEAIQIVDGYIIYEVSDWNGDELVEFTIAVPGKESLYLTGQKLQHRCHSFEGNLKFEAALGGDIIIPLFKPVDKSICPGK